MPEFVHEKFGKESIESDRKSLEMSKDYELSNYYRITATVFWESAKTLAADFNGKRQPVSGNRLAVPFYHLVSHATELLLKCAILKRGGTAEELKKFPIRHSLKLLMQKLLSLGIPVSANTSSLIDILSQQHERHILRYEVFHPNNEISVYTPQPEDIFEMLTELLMAGRISTYGR